MGRACVAAVAWLNIVVHHELVAQEPAVLAGIAEQLCIRLLYEAHTPPLSMFNGAPYITRIGTNPDDTKCPGHNNAVRLRLYYDAVSRPSRFGAELTPDAPQDFCLHSDGTDFLDETTPTTPTAKFKDSAGVNFTGGNPWKEIGTWSMPLP